MFDRLDALGRLIYRGIEAVGDLVTFLKEVIQTSLTYGIRWRVTVEQMYEVGVRSTSLIVLTGLFTGFVFALQTSYAFGLFGAEGLIGPSVVLSLMRELAPVLGGLMLTARAGSAMATELGTMRVTEQIDALQVMAVQPMRYLVVPRVVAATVMLPLLVVVFNFVGFIGAYIVSLYVVGINRHQFLGRILSSIDLWDLYQGLLKAAVFGILIALICTSRGYFAKGGARGVGRATTEAVVMSSVTILVSDYLMTALMSI